MTDEKSFVAGYVLAVANIMHLHDEPTIAEDVLLEGGMSFDDVKALNLTEYDLAVLQPLFTAIDADRQKPTPGSPTPSNVA